METERIKSNKAEFTPEIIDTLRNLPDKRRPKQVYKDVYDFVLCLVLDRDLKIRFVIVFIILFTSTSVFSLSKNANDNNVFAQDTNATVIVENRALSPENLLCDDGNHPGAKGICSDGSHPLVIRANPLPITEKFVNQTYPATTNTVSLCADRTVANSTIGKCHDGSLPLQLSTEDLTCTNDNHPVPNGICTDGSLPLLLNKTKTAVTVK